MTTRLLLEYGKAQKMIISFVHLIVIKKMILTKRNYRNSKKSRV